MPFTVTRTGGIPGRTFEPYLRLLHLQGKDLSDQPRLPDPSGSNRWLVAWETEREAETFAEQLREHSSDPEWHVEAVEGPIGRGPLGPIELECSISSVGITFGLHPLSRRMIRTRFPESCRLESVFLCADPDHPYHLGRPAVAGVAEQVLLLLTQLTAAELAPFGGFRLADAVSQRVILPAPSSVHCGP